MATGGTSLSEEWRRAALALIHGESTLTLATADSTGPWSAPVYFILLDERFFFFSSPQSRHIRQAIASKETAASLFHQTDAWKSIRGIQMTGSVERIGSVSASLKPIAVYLHRFPFTREFFPDDPKPDLNAFFSRFKARLYAFTPIEVYYIDNRFGLGSRRRIEW